MTSLAPEYVTPFAAAGARRRWPAPPTLAVGLGLLLSAVAAEPVSVQAQPAAAGTTGAAAPSAAAGRSGAAIPPLRLANPGPGGGGGNGVLRIAALRGEVQLDKGGHSGSPEPLTQTSLLAVRDEVSTQKGSVELVTSMGTSLRLGPDALVSLLSPFSLYLARGELQLSTGQTSAQQSIFVVTPCGRVPVKARDARIRVEGSSAVVSVYDGMAFVGGYPPAGVPVQSGQSNRCTKGEPFSPSRPLPVAPGWTDVSNLVLVGDGGSPTEVTLRWATVPMAQRYRVELFRNENEAEPTPVSTTEALAARPQVELRELDVGSYLARVYALDENGAASPEGPAHRFLLLRVSGLGSDGTIRTEAGQMPRVNAPPNLPTSVLLDGNVPPAGAPSPGSHKLRVMIAGLSAEVPLVASGLAVERPAEPAVDTASQGEPIEQPAPTPQPTTPQPGPGSPSPTEEPLAKPPAPTPSPGPEDVLLGGVGEVPLDGIRSPWAGRYMGARFESTVSGSMRLVAGGRLVMKNGFGLDASIALLRAALGSRPDGESVAGIGNVNVAARTPALRTQHIALQGIVGLVMPLSTSFLDTSIEVDPQYADPTTGSTLKPDVRSRGGGWRIEPAVLFGVRTRHFALSTMQGASLRLAPDFSASYAGGLMVHADIVPQLRFITFAAWQVNYLNVMVSPGDSLPDVGGAVGGGFEGLIPGGKRGNFRLALLGRVGLGDGGAAIYGRGTLGAQFGYLFN